MYACFIGHLVLVCIKYDALHEVTWVFQKDITLQLVLYNNTVFQLPFKANI